MLINTKKYISKSDLNQNFLKVTNLVDEDELNIILKNNIPKYPLLDHNELKTEIFASDNEVIEFAQNIISRNIIAFKELAK